MNIVYISDDKGCFLLCVSLYSLLEKNNQHELRIIIIDDDISDNNKSLIDKIVCQYGLRVEYVEKKEIPQTIKEKSKGQWPDNIFSRLFFPSLLGELNIHRCIYLDTDTIIMGDLSTLWEKDLRGMTCGAVLECMPNSHKQVLGLSAKDEYYNSGVLIVDVDMWRKKGYEESCFRYLKDNIQCLEYPDEGTINSVLKGDICRLGAEYNVTTLNGCFSYKELKTYRKSSIMYEADEYIMCREKPVIVHYTNNFLYNRPWQVYKKRRHLFHDEWIRCECCLKKYKEYHRNFLSKQSVRKVVEQVICLLPKRLVLPIMGAMYCYIKPIEIIRKYEKNTSISRI
jgi:lipopolysaccharide biosynthesis glycosyltransferase